MFKLFQIHFSKEETHKKLPSIFQTIKVNARHSPAKMWKCSVGRYGPYNRTDHGEMLTLQLQAGRGRGDHYCTNVETEPLSGSWELSGHLTHTLPTLVSARESSLQYVFHSDAPLPWKYPILPHKATAHLLRDFIFMIAGAVCRATMCLVRWQQSSVKLQ